jgi:hypothetical protein
LILPRDTHPSPDTKPFIEKLKLQLPGPPPPRLAAQKDNYEIEVGFVRQEVVCGEDLVTASYDSTALNWIRGGQTGKFGLSFS